MRISHFPIIAIEMVFGAGLLAGMLERAMKACVTRSLPDVWLDFVHIVESRNMAVSDEELGAAGHATTHRFRYARNAAARFAQPKAGPEAAIQI